MPRKPSKYTGHEEVKVGDDVYLFKSDFSFIAALKDHAELDPLQIFAAFSEGKGEPELVINVLECALLEVNGTPVDPAQRRPLCEGLISSYGFLEVWTLAQQLLSYGMLGDVKKRAARQDEKARQTMTVLGWSGSRSQIVRSQLLLWAYLLTISGICALLSSKAAETLI